MVTRRNVYELGADWADDILWYARGVKILQQRALADRTGWRFFAAIHGFDPQMWQAVGYLSNRDAPADDADVASFWAQCQHGSWYFLPWHRGYLIAFEATVRAAILGAGGPAGWALPYWNYFKAGQDKLPPAFASPDWPDGKGDNPLFVTRRYGPNNDGNVYVALDEVNLQAMTDPEFTGVDGGGSPGFGGVDTGFSHGGQTHGALETQPHDYVHGLVGGSDPSSPPADPLPGLMSDPDIAALDPIFWLHHANIDRLWEVWRANPPSDQNPTDPSWLQGPASVGQRAFAMPMPDGTTWTYVPAGMVDLATLGYTYDDVSPSVAPAPLAARIANLRPGAAATPSILPMSNTKITELVGASQGAIAVHGAEIRATVRFDAGVHRQLVASLRAAAHEAPPDRVFLNLENVRGKLDSAAFHVFIDVPSAGGGRASHKAGSLALFGLRKASAAGGEHGGQGLNFVIEITKIVDGLHLAGALDPTSVEVRLVPVKPIPQEAGITVERISIVRQGAK
jgi:tyrosinase